MIKVTIANNLKTFLQGKSDGLIFSDVNPKDVDCLKRLAETYGKQISLIELNDVVSFTNEPCETPVIDKRKIKKIFITNGKEVIKITPDKLPEYIQKGYRTGRKK